MAVSRKMRDLAEDRNLRAPYPSLSGFMRECTCFFYPGVSAGIEPDTGSPAHTEKEA